MKYPRQRVHRIFRPDAIPALRYMIRRDPLSFATLGFIPGGQPEVTFAEVLKADAEDSVR